MLRLTTVPLPDDAELATADLRLAEELQDRLRRDEQTARALREYLVEHPPGS